MLKARSTLVTIDETVSETTASSGQELQESGSPDTESLITMWDRRASIELMNSYTGRIMSLKGKYSKALRYFRQHENDEHQKYKHSPTRDNTIGIMAKAFLVVYSRSPKLSLHELKEQVGYSIA